MIGTWEIIFIILIILILFGANKIPDFVRALNISIKEFKNAATNIQDNSNQENE